MAANSINGALTISRCYRNDITSTLNGTIKIYPSKFVLFKKSNQTTFADNIQLNLASSISSWDTSAKDVYDEIDLMRLYTRDFLFYTDPSNLSTQSYSNEEGHMIELVAGKVVAVGDINFLDSMYESGGIYSGITLNIDGMCAATRNNIANPAGEQAHNLNQSIIIPDPHHGEPSIETDSSSNKFIEFNRIVLLYNVYSAVNTTEHQSVPLALDIPMGVFDFTSTQKIYVSNETIYQASSSLVVKLYIALSNGATTLSLASPSTTSNADDSTISNIDASMAQILKSVASCVDAAMDVVKNNVNDISDTKAFLDEFRNNRHVNVPYLVGNSWFVNGKYICEK